MTRQPEQAAAAVDIAGLQVTAAGRQVLRGVDLRCEQGRIHVIVGPSGSGKTTLLRAINRLNDLFGRYETRGEVTVPWDDGVRRVYGDTYPREQLRRRVGMVFQHPNVLPVSIRRNFTIPLGEVLGRRGDAAEAVLRAMLTEVGLWDEVADRLDEPATRLSGGQQQRLCLARALALEPSVLLLDEPTANLDFRAAQGIENLLLGLKDRYVLMVVSHSLEQAARLADRIVLLQGGRVGLDLDVGAEHDPSALAATVAARFEASDGI